MVPWRTQSAPLSISSVGRKHSTSRSRYMPPILQQQTPIHCSLQLMHAKAIQVQIHWLSLTRAVEDPCAALGHRFCLVGANPKDRLHEVMSPFDCVLRRVTCPSQSADTCATPCICQDLTVTQGSGSGRTSQPSEGILIAASSPLLADPRTCVPSVCKYTRGQAPQWLPRQRYHLWWAVLGRPSTAQCAELLLECRLSEPH